MNIDTLTANTCRQLHGLSEQTGQTRVLNVQHDKYPLPSLS